MSLLVMRIQRLRPAVVLYEVSAGDLVLHAAEQRLALAILAIGLGIWQPSEFAFVDL